MAHRDFNLGSARWKTNPECTILQETKHTRGGWVSLVQSIKGRDTGKFFVCVREHRRAKSLTILQPKEWKWTNGREQIDAPFVVEWEYTWGFADNQDAALAYIKHVLAHDDHPGVPKATKSTFRARDAQRSKCYDWEANFYQPSRVTISQEQARALAYQIRHDFDSLIRFKKMEVRMSFHRRGGSFCRGTTEINIAPYQVNRDVVVHEMAHLITHNLYDSGARIGHGAEFIGIFMLMLAHYQGYCLTDMINKAVEMNLKFRFPSGGFRDIFATKIDERMAA